MSDDQSQGVQGALGELRGTLTGLGRDMGEIKADVRSVRHSLNNLQQREGINDEFVKLVKTKLEEHDKLVERVKTLETHLRTARWAAAGLIAVAAYFGTFAKDWLLGSLPRKQ